MLFSVVGLLTMVSPPYVAKASETWEQWIRDANLDSLVFITVKAKRGNGLEDTFAGTGFIVHPDGYVLTCNHVIPENKSLYTEVEITGSVNGRYEHHYPLTVVRRDEQGDLMLLKLPQKTWRNVKSIGQAQVGAPIVALGFPLDQDVVAVPGSITGVKNDGQWLTNAGLNPRMSGGPAFDRSGAVVGIVAAGYKEAESLNLLIPVSSSMSLLLFVNSPLLSVNPPPVATTAPNPESSPTPTSPTQKLVPGAILEAWVLPRGFTDNSPPGMSMGSMVDSGTLFDLDNFLSEDAFTSLNGSFVGLKWSGLIHIEDRGKYNFVLERHGGTLYPWFVSFKISGQTVISQNNPAGEVSDVTQQQVQLDPDFHPFELFTYSWGMQNHYSQHQLRIKIRSEKSTLPIPLDANTVFHTPTPSPTPSPSPIPTPLSQDRLVPGAILEAWVLPRGFTDNSPPGMSMGSMVDSKTLFDLDNFFSEDAFTSLKGSFVGLKWSGFILIKERGKYNFVLERDGGTLYPWFVLFKISDQTVFSKNNPVSGIFDVTQQPVRLDPDFHPFELFTYSWGMQNYYSQHQLRLKIRSEYSTLPIPLDDKAIFHKQ
jgi:S1-C subfamily serine protease